MADSKIINLVKQLHIKTLEGRIPWEITAAGDTFSASFSDYSIELYYFGDDFEDTITISIFNNEGRLIEKIDNNEFKIGDLPKASFDFLSEIFNMARRQAMGADEAIDSIISELEN